MARIYLGGAESIELLDTLLTNDSTHVALSFFYLQQRGALPRMLKLLGGHPSVKVFLDSGSRAFLKKQDVDPQIYWRAYFDFLKVHGHRFEYATEFNIEGYTWHQRAQTRTVSQEQVDVWREDLAELGTVAIVPMWSPARGMEAWDALLHDPQYTHLGVGDDAQISTGRGVDAGISKGGGDARISRGEGGKLVAQAHAWGKTVHGYGSLASIDDLAVTHVDTLVSSTWLVGQRFGDICVFQGGHYSRIYASSKEGKKARKRYRAYFTRIGIDPTKIEQDDRQELNKANIYAWNQFAARVHLASPHKGPAHVPVASPRVDSPDPKGESAAPINGAPQPTVSAGTRMAILPKESPVTSMESVSVERTEDSAISLPENTKPFMPSIAPPMLCAKCLMKNECPKYGGEGAVCAYQAEFAAVNTRDANEVVEQLAAIFSVNVERARYLRLWEQIQGGGMIDPGTTKHFEQTFTMGAKLAELMKGKKSVKTTAQGQGVLSRLFNGLGGAQPKTVIAGEDEHEGHALPEHYEDDAADDDDEKAEVLTDRQRRQSRGQE